MHLLMPADANNLQTCCAPVRSVSVRGRRTYHVLQIRRYMDTRICMRAHA